MSDELKPCENFGIGDEVCIHGYVDEIRCDTVIIRNDGGYFGTVPHEVMPDVANARADDAPEQRVDNAQADSREQLEADVYDGCSDVALSEQMRDVLRSRVHTWLDRQAAITRAEVFADGEYDCRTCDAKRELQERVDSLEAERDELQEQREKQAATIKDLTAERNIYRWELGELENNMAREIAELLDENDVIEVFNELGKRRLVTGTQHKLEKQVEELTAERDQLQSIIDHMPKTEQECEACQEAHDRLMFNAKVHQDDLRYEVDSLTAQRDAARQHEEELLGYLIEKQRTVEIQRDSFLKLEAENAELRRMLADAAEAI